MRAIDKLCGGSAQEAIAEIILEQCPQYYRQFEHLPQLCGGDYDKATVTICTDCWNQQAEEDGMSNYIELHINGEPILVKEASIVYVSQDFRSERACICLAENRHLRFDETYTDVKKLLNEAEGGQK